GSKVRVAFESALDLSNRVEHRRMIAAAEARADLRERQRSELTSENHPDLARTYETAHLRFRNQSPAAGREARREKAQTPFDVDRAVPRASRRANILDRGAGELERRCHATLGSTQSEEVVHRAFELAKAFIG